MPNVPTVTIPEGTLIHIGGFPFRLTAPTPAEGSQEALDRGLVLVAEGGARPMSALERAWDNPEDEAAYADL